MLVLVKKLDHTAPSAYAARQVDALLNLDAVVGVAPVQERGSGPFLRVELARGEPWIIVGTPEALLANQTDTQHARLLEALSEDLRRFACHARDYLRQRKRVVDRDLVTPLTIRDRPSLEEEARTVHGLVVLADELLPKE